MNAKNARLDVTNVTQSANELLGKKETNLYYLIIETEIGKLTVNVGEKTYKEVNRLTEEIIPKLTKKEEEEINKIDETIKKNKK